MPANPTTPNTPAATRFYGPGELAQALYRKAFSVPRDARSSEYREGVLMALRGRAGGERIVCPYPAGTASFDAFFAGVGEGNHLWIRHLEGGLPA